MLDHISIGVRDAGASKPFYDAALKPLGYSCLSQSPVPSATAPKRSSFG